MSPSNPLLSAVAAGGAGNPAGGGGGGAGMAGGAGGPLEVGIGGGGGASEPGIGGGGGAVVEGIGGAGGGTATGRLSDSSSNAPGMGGATEGDDGFCVGIVALVGLSTDLISSIAESGRGGAMVPNSIEASCLALPPVTWSGPSSSSEEDVESTTDHSSSSCRRRDIGPPACISV